jgi:exonuclease III
VPWPERILSVMIESPWGNIEFHTAHIPAGCSKPHEKKVETLEGIYRRLARTEKHPRILCGDFNTPQRERCNDHSDHIVTWGQFENRNGVLQVCKSFRGISGERYHRAEHDVLQGLSNFDLSDIYRLNGYDAQDYSWYWTGKGRTIGRRFDHVFASLSLNPVECRYLHHCREDGLSDHAAIVACFAPTNGFSRKLPSKIQMRNCANVVAGSRMAK